MIARGVILFLFIISLSGIIIMYGVKVAHQFRYLRLRDKKNPGPTADFFYRHFIDKTDAERWKKAWMMFPLLFPVMLDEDREELNDIKRQIKRANMNIYAALIVAMLAVLYASKAYPEGIF